MFQVRMAARRYLGLFSMAALAVTFFISPGELRAEASCPCELSSPVGKQVVRLCDRVDANGGEILIDDLTGLDLVTACSKPTGNNTRVAAFETRGGTEKSCRISIGKLGGTPRILSVTNLSAEEASACRSTVGALFRDYCPGSNATCLDDRD